MQLFLIINTAPFPRWHACNNDGPYITEILKVCCIHRVHTAHASALVSHLLYYHLLYYFTIVFVDLLSVYWIQLRWIAKCDFAPLIGGHGVKALYKFLR